MKKVIAAAIVRVLEFDNAAEAQSYLESLQLRQKIYKAINQKQQKDGKVWLRIATNYNSSPLIEEE